MFNAFIPEFPAEVNRETGRTENRPNLLQLEQQLLFRPSEQVVRTSNTDLKGPFVVYSRMPLGSAVKGRGSPNDIYGPSETAWGLAMGQGRIIGHPARPCVTYGRAEE